MAINPTGSRSADSRSADSRSADNRREAVLRLVQAAPEPLTIAAIADDLGVHVNTVRFHLDALITSGRVERAPSGPADHPGRPAIRYRAVRGMDPDGRREYRLLAEILLDGMGSGTDAAGAGRRWGATAARRQPASRGRSAKRSIGLLVGLLGELGFAPERRKTDAGEGIGLRNCPFLELAKERSEVACPVHLGIMQGALEGWQAPITVESLDPFVEPDLCLAHLSTLAGAGKAQR